MQSYNGWTSIDTFKAVNLIINDRPAYIRAVLDHSKENLEVLLFNLIENLDVEYLMFSEVNWNELEEVFAQEYRMHHEDDLDGYLTELKNV